MKAKSLFKNSKITLIIWSVLIIILTLFSLHKALYFGFWRDDWLYVWALEVLKDPSFFDGTKLGTAYLLDLYRLVFLSYILDLNPFGWQASSVFFRIIVPFTSTLLLYGLTKSKIASLIFGLFSAAGIAGLEPASFMGSNNVTFFLIFLTLGFYYWVVSYGFSRDIKKFNLKEIFNIRYFSSLLILLVIAKGEQWSYYIIPVLALGWDLLCLIETKSLKNIKAVLARNIPLWFLLWIFLSIGPSVVQNTNIWSTLEKIEINSLKNLFASLGNLLIGSFVYISESGGLSSQIKSSVFVGILMILTIIFTSLFYLFKPSRNLKIIVFLMAWIIIFYFPNWWFEPTLTVGASHRYVAVPGVGLYAIFAIILSQLLKKAVNKKNRSLEMFLFIIIVGFLINSIYLSNKVLDGLATFRSNEKIQNVIKSINKSIPQNQEDFVVFYAGEGLIRGYILDWSLGIPIALERNITDRTKFPIWTGSEENLRKLVCGEKITVSLIGIGEQYQRGGYSYPSEQIHSFYIKDSGEVINNSEQTRKEFNPSKVCKSRS